MINIADELSPRATTASAHGSRSRRSTTPCCGCSPWRTTRASPLRRPLTASPNSESQTRREQVGPPARTAGGALPQRSTLLSGHHLELDFPPAAPPGPRWGHGHPVHPRLLEIISRNDNTYRGQLEMPATRIGPQDRGTHGRRLAQASSGPTRTSSVWTHLRQTASFGIADPVVTSRSDPATPRGSPPERNAMAQATRRSRRSIRHLGQKSMRCAIGASTRRSSWSTRPCLRSWGLAMSS